ncbi:MAG: HAD family phosphatase [Butyrivibrio sp.]|nr:HAD family phosphatase [Butyrivibrio sp.]
MNKKIFFFDLDGTLLNSQKTISPATKNALKTFTNSGNHFVICTGRAMDSILQLQKELSLFYPGTFLAAFNGAQIYDCDTKKTIYRTGISINLVSQIFDLAKDHGIHIQTYSDTHIITCTDDECTKYYRHFIPSPLLLSSDIHSALITDPCKCIAIELHDHQKMEHFRKSLLRLVGSSLSIMYSSPYYLEIFPAEAGKGSAVTRLCEYLQIPIENVLAAGDGQNDISMIQAAGTGIAMLNAAEDVKASADRITDADNDHDGLVPFLLA